MIQKNQYPHWRQKKLTIETGKIARQADGAVQVSYGDTVVFGVRMFEKNSPGATWIFFPLTVGLSRKTTMPPAAFRGASSSARAGRARRRS